MFETFEEIVQLIADLTFEEIWAKIKNWPSIHSGNYLRIPENFSKPITREELHTRGVCFKIVSSQGNWADRINLMYNTMNRPLHERHMVHWDSLRFLKVFHKYSEKLSQRSFVELQIRIVEYFLKRKDILLPAFLQNGKFYVASKSVNNVMEMRFHAQIRK